MKTKLFLFASLLMVAQSTALADDWDWGITPYLWAAGIDGSVSAGSLNAEMSVDFEDIANVLQGGAIDYRYLRDRCYWDFKTKLIPPVLAGVRRSSDWTDGFIGARLSNSLAGKWQWVLRANVGAGGSDLALGMDLDFRRELASGNQFSLGFRALDVESNDLSGVVPVDLNTTFAGLTIGYTFNL